VRFSRKPGHGSLWRSTIFIREQEIRPDQIGTYKISFHRDFIREWLSQHRELSGFTPETSWSIREECISALDSAESRF
jgi:hypothetical protein